MRYSLAVVNLGVRLQGGSCKPALPILRYNDARMAIQFLCATFGFIELFSVPKSGAVIRHAQLKLDTNIPAWSFPLGIPLFSDDKRRINEALG